MAFNIKKLLKRLPNIPGGKVAKIGGALAAGPVFGPVNPFALDPEVIGARGSAKRPGLSVDQAQVYKQDERDAATAEGVRVAAAEREGAAQTEAQRVQEGQLAERRRKKRFAYGYDRAGDAGGLGGVGDAGGQKTLLGY